MKQSKILIQTLRNIPRDADVVSQQLMIKAGMLHKISAGIYSYLPMLLRSIRKLENIIREELSKDGCQELLMPVVQPSEFWQESGRWHIYGKELLRFKDRKDADFCLGPTHEEIITDIVRRNVKSYRQLPMNLFQIQTKFRDEIRPRFGLMRGREFIMKDGYSFDIDVESADKTYWLMYNAYKRIFSRLGINFCCVEADSGAIGGSYTHEFHVLAGSGEDAILSCDNCDYVSNIEKADASIQDSKFVYDQVMPLRLAHFWTPEIISTEEQAKAFKDEHNNGIPLSCVSKTYLLHADVLNSKTNKLHKIVIVAVLRGDHDINLVKVKNYLNAVNLEPMQEVEQFTGATSGFLGPIPREGTIYWDLWQKNSNTIVYLVDSMLQEASNLTCGANITGAHHFGFSPSRDLPNAKFIDIRFAQENELCPRCNKGHYKYYRGIEVGQVFKLGTKYSKAMNCVYLDEHGHEQYMIMGCYGIGITRTISAVIEQNYDVDGMIWPWSIAPYQIHLINLNPKDSKISAISNKIETDLEQANFEVLHDDCEGVSPGIKFKNADLLGFPLRITVGSRDLSNGVVEIRDRRNKKIIKINPDNVVSEISLLRDKLASVYIN